MLLIDGQVPAQAPPAEGRRVPAWPATLGQLCAAVALLGTIGGDARWITALGSAVLDTGAVPEGVPFATADSSGWHNVPVAAEVVFASLDAIFGDSGLLLAQVLAAAVALTALAVDARRADATDSRTALGLALVVLGCSATFFVVRLQLFSLALFPVLVLLLRAETRRPSGRIWVVVPLLALWSNLHGGALVGLAVTGAYLLVHRARRDLPGTAALLAASTAALCITPAGVHTPLYYATVLTGEAAKGRDGMWGRLTLDSPFDVLYLLVTVLAVAAFLRARPASWQLVAAAGLLVMTAQAARHGVWLLLFLVPVALTTSRRREDRAAQPVWGAVAMVAVVALGVGLARGPQPAGASPQLVARAVDLARGEAVMAEGVLAEQVVQEGGRVWMGNPLDAFSRTDQRAYLDWMRTGVLPAEAPSAVLVVMRGGSADGRLRTSSTHRLAVQDLRASIYVAAGR